MNTETFTSSLLMVRPANFNFNEQTAESNTFQNTTEGRTGVQEKALYEFDHFVEILRENGLDIIVLDDEPQLHTPDSVFPNNWFSTHADGTIFLYPMAAENRRLERRNDLEQILSEHFKIETVRDLSNYETEGKYLEGTGSMVLDRQNKTVYACLSDRTHPDVLKKFSQLSGYQIISFHGFTGSGKPVYHTNVMMCIGQRFTVICSEAVTDSSERAYLLNTLRKFNKEIIEISTMQMNHFAGNMLQAKNKKGELLLILSDQALQSLNDEQIKRIESHCRLVHAPLYTIETVGGGSARCMLAEIYLPAK